MMTATLGAWILAAVVTGTVSAETTHEANQAMAVSTPTPPLLTADSVLAQITAADGMLHFEVAEDGTRFVWADHATFSDQRSAAGAPFLAQGYIYPEDTLSAMADGVNTDGSPQFPEKVLGAWTCYGWYVGGGAQVTNTPWILATQIYQFGSEWGAVTLISEGYVPASRGGTVERAITGGTGPFATARGQVRATALGSNQTDGSNARYEVKLWTP
jgi:hypothetical protein